MVGMLGRNFVARISEVAARLRRALIVSLSLSLILSGAASAAMAAKHALDARSMSHPHAEISAEAAADHGGCSHPDTKDDGSCCDHVGCVTGWITAALPEFPAGQARARAVNALAPAGLVVGRHFPSLEPPKA